MKTEVARLHDAVRRSVQETLSPCHETTSTAVELVAVHGILLSARRPSLQKGLLRRSYNFNKKKYEFGTGLMTREIRSDLNFLRHEASPEFMFS
jgi:hypothetical protein